MTHAQWIRTRRAILDQIKSQVRQRIGSESEDIKKYSSYYYKEFYKRWIESTKKELVQAVCQSDIVYGADFHAFFQAQRTHLRILRSLPPQKRVIIGIEAIEAKYQAEIDLYVSGNLKEESFLKRVHWNESWGFPWENYRPLFDLAKKRKYKLLALNLITPKRTKRELERRDLFAAKIIGNYLKKSSGTLVYVIFGDLHLAPHHLPRRVREFVKKNAYNELTIFQNSEKIFFDLARKGLETHVDVVRLSKNEYCVLGAPPWVQWQSYLIFLEQNYDQDLDDETFFMDFTEHVASYVQLLSKDLNINLDSINLEVYNSMDERFWNYMEQHLSRTHFHIASFLVKTGRSFYMPKEGAIYLARGTVNHAAHLAGEYIHSRLSQRNRLLWDGRKDFLSLIWTEAIAFFLSKWINGHRASATLRDLKAELAVSHPKDKGREPLLLALAQKMKEVNWLHKRKMKIRKPKVKRKESYLEAAKILGSMLGEKLYLCYRALLIKREEVVELLEHKVDSEDFEEFYKSAILNIDSLPYLVKSKQERL